MSFSSNAIMASAEDNPSSPRDELDDVDIDGPVSTPPVSRSRKRPLGESRLSTSYPRKRAVAACQVCRIRKVKCTNERPTCATCARAGATCIYADDTDHSSFDPAVLLLLQRLDEIQHQVQSLSEQRAPFPPPENAPAPDPEASEFYPDRAALEVTTICASADAVFSWPIFGIVSTEADLPVSELFIPPLPFDTSVASSGVISEENCPRLVENFIEHVHIKDPILDPVDIRNKARALAESGPGWDPSSCLVLLCCALGAIARPFDVTPKNFSELHAHSSLHVDPKARLSAESYFRMARKRFGLLEHDLTSCQCYLLSAIYQMYVLRPVKAWDDFVKASITFSVYWKGQNVHRQHGSESYEQQRLEQIVYWTSVKSECGIRMEMPLPGSGISSIDFPSAFPSPPGPPTHTPSQWSDSFGQPSPEQPIDRSWDTQYWYYYLTDIVMRRISNRVLNLLYEEDCVSWPAHKIHSLSKTVAEFERQLQEWKDSLPEAICFSDTDDDPHYPLDELRFTIKTRYHAIKLTLYRPFLGYLVSHPSCDPSIQRILIPLSYKALEICRVQNSNGVGVLHRHHGVWYFCRYMGLRALLVLAVKRAGLVGTLNLDGLADYEADLDRAVHNAVYVLRYWELESVDLRKMRLAIENLML